MKLLNSLLFKLLIAAVIVLVLLVAIDNSQAVSLKFVDYETFQLPLLWWMVIAFCFGVVFTALVNSFGNTKLKLQVRSAKKTAEKANLSLDELKAEQSIS